MGPAAGAPSARRDPYTRNPKTRGRKPNGTRTEHRMMRRRHQLGTFLTILYWSFYVPFAITKHLYRLTGRVIGTAALRNRDSLHCAACGKEVSLVGRWECGW